MSTLLGLILSAAPAGPAPAALPDPQENPLPPKPARPPTDEKQISDLVREKTGHEVRIHRGKVYTIFTDDPALDAAALDKHLSRALRIFQGTLEVTLPEGTAGLPVIHFGRKETYTKFCEAMGLEEYAADGYGCYAPAIPFRPVIVHGVIHSTLRHEASHQFVEEAMGVGAARTVWVTEGLGALFEAYPPEEFFRFRRYREGRERVLDPGFSLERFVETEERGKGVYGVGATIHGVFLFGPHRPEYLRWLGDLARKKCTPRDLARYLGRTWEELLEDLRLFCRQNHPPERNQTPEAETRIEIRRG